MLFPKALFLVTNFPKIVKNSIFLLNFHWKLSNFSRNFPTICVFRPNTRKINAWFVKLFEKYVKIMHFSNFLKKFLKISENSPASGGGSAPGPPGGRPPKVFSPRTKILATPMAGNNTSTNYGLSKRFYLNILSLSLAFSG